MEKKLVDRLLLIVVICVVAFIYKGWFIKPYIIGGDWPYFHEEYLQSVPVVPQVWMPLQQNGLGGVDPVLNLSFFQNITTLPTVLWPHIPWNITYKIAWFGLFLIVSFISSVSLARLINTRLWIIAPLIYMTNTYALLLVGGGQMGVALAYAIAPLVLSTAIVAFEKPRTRTTGIAGLVMGIQVMMDPRISYICIFALILYAVLMNRKSISTLMGIGSIAVFLNAYWILPMLLLKNNPLHALGTTYTSKAAVEFFSFADFSHAMSLLHPNWPENIFGKTYFLQPEFLILPIVVFAGLLFFRNGNRKRLGYAALLAIIGIFLAKGANDPFGWIYIWLFQHIPGFIVFRDSTKFYILIAIAYSVLIPFVLSQFRFRRIVVFVFIFFWLILIRNSVTGSLRGTFVSHEMPQDFNNLKYASLEEKSFYRTLWVPRQSRFSYYDGHHRATEANGLFEATTAAELKKQLEEKQEMMDEMAIRYMIIPLDPLGEIFLEDRKFSQSKRDEYIHVLDEISGLKKIQKTDNIVYSRDNHWDLFHVSNGEVAYTYIGPNHYRLHVSTMASDSIYFSEAYHPGWIAKDQYGNIVSSTKTIYGLNRFEIQKAGTYDFEIYFRPQRYGDYGFIISAITLIGILCIIIARL